MAYEITGDLARALQDVQERYNARLVAPGRSTADALGEARIGEDATRLDLLRQLRLLAADPARSAAINGGVEAQVALARRTADDAAGAATGNATMDAAGSGLLGGSRINRARGQIVAGRDQSVREAAGAAEDWRQGVLDADQNYLGSVLQDILNPTAASQGAMQSMQQGFQANLGLGEQLRQVRENQNQLLSQTLGGFLQNTAAPNIAGAFRVAGARRDATQRGVPYQSAWDTLMTGGG